MDKNEKKSPEFDVLRDYDFLQSSSANDCTGSVPRPPENDAELESYLDVYNFLPQSEFAKGKNLNDVRNKD